ncbi:hypothetical protein [Bacillus suaedae]|uniref:Uncharacterized protein n=1 Tax=Halalkalibacter suaedae TaxID=2822140 RepID=A0A940WU27_9BACI|nr:hypothetical protein [Bacillus suaedae]MBP3950238.1 hypothetical protein [Bacillus suaedae]
MKFKYSLSGTGWATCIVEVNGQKLEFTASYLTDCLYDFLRSLMLLNSFCVPKDETRRETECEWEGEPEGIIWSFELKENNILNIKAVYYENEGNKDKTKTLIKTEYPYDDFIMNVLTELDVLIKRHGIIGYREEWDGFDFPLTAYLKLKHYIIHKQKYPIKEAQGEFDIETRSNLKYDLELLLQEFNSPS